MEAMRLRMRATLAPPSGTRDRDVASGAHAAARGGRKEGPPELRRVEYGDDRYAEMHPA